MRKDFVISNDQGVHARPATLLVSRANQFDSDITIEFENEKVDLKSIMGVLSLGVSRGSLITIETKGKDEVEAMESLARLIAEFNMQ